MLTSLITEQAAGSSSNDIILVISNTKFAQTIETISGTFEGKE